MSTFVWAKCRNEPKGNRCFKKGKFFTSDWIYSEPDENTTEHTIITMSLISFVISKKYVRFEERAHSRFMRGEIKG